MTSEKQTPSPINIAADLGAAVDMERKSSALMAKAALKDCLSKVVASYNRMCTNKKHKVDSAKRALVYNMYVGFCPVRFSF